MSLSLAQRVALLPPDQRREWLMRQEKDILDEIVRGEWWWTARPEQIPPPGDWLVHLVLSGRGWGKSRAGSEWVVDRIIRYPRDRSGAPTERLVIGETLSDTRAICIEGPSGILRVLDRRGIKYKYVKNPKPKIIVAPGIYDAVIYFEGADNPDVGRGYNAADAWLDEIAKWPYPKPSWMEGIMPGLRADLPGDHPRAFVTTTPKPIDLLMEWLERNDGSVSIVRGSTFDNAANLSSHVLAELRLRYDGTSLGRQELYGEMLDALDGVLFKWKDIEGNRVSIGPEVVAHRTVGVDPTLSSGDEEGSSRWAVDEMGVVVASRDHRDHIYILADETVRLVGREAALHAWSVFDRYQCDSLVYEDNLGKAWMRQVFTDTYRELQDRGVFPAGNHKPPMAEIHANQGKQLRAEPVGLRYEQGRVHHIGKFENLESQMIQWDPVTSKESPDRLDAMVHAVRHLIEGESKKSRILSARKTQLYLPGPGMGTSTSFY
jgi:phage terminase large subunit-like protein